MKRITLIVMMWVALISPAYSIVGLDCAKAQGKVEHLICDAKNNPALWSLDSEMNTYYNYLLGESENKQDVIAAQKKWLRDVRNVCKAADCLKNAYESHIAELQQVTTLCRAQEIAVFTCTLAQNKMVSLCASQDVSPDAGYMQFRMGSNHASMDIEFPQQKAPAKNFFKYYSWNYPKGGTHALSFWDGEYRYSLFLSQSANSYNGAGVILSRGHPPVRVSFTKCVGRPATFSQFGRYSSDSFFQLGDRLDLPDVDGDISTYGPETDADFGKNPEDGPPRPGELEESPR